MQKPVLVPPQRDTMDPLEQVSHHQITYIQAHEHASRAEVAFSNGDYGAAIDAHFKAAENYLTALAYTSDPEAIKTLRILHSKHTKTAKDLQKRISRSSPRESMVESFQTAAESRIGQQQMIQRKSLTRQSNRTSASSSYFLNNSIAPTIRPALMHPSTIRVGSIDDGEIASQGSNSQYEKSYFVLGHSAVPQADEEDNDDPFNRFWDVVEGLVQKISLPSALTSAPLNGQPIHDKQPRFMEKSPLSTGSSMQQSSAILHSYFVVPPPQSQQRKIYDDDVAQTRGRSIHELEDENTSLRNAVDQLTQRIQLLERAQEENNMLRSSIVQFRNDFQRQAHKYKKPVQVPKVHKATMTDYADDIINEAIGRQGFQEHATIPVHLEEEEASFWNDDESNHMTINNSNMTDTVGILGRTESTSSQIPGASIVWHTSTS